MISVEVDRLDADLLFEHFPGEILSSLRPEWLALLWRIYTREPNPMLDVRPVQHCQRVAIGNLHYPAGERVGLGLHGLGHACNREQESEGVTSMGPRLIRRGKRLRAMSARSHAASLQWGAADSPRKVEQDVPSEPICTVLQWGRG